MEASTSCFRGVADHTRRYTGRRRPAGGRNVRTGTPRPLDRAFARVFQHVWPRLEVVESGIAAYYPGSCWQISCIVREWPRLDAFVFAGEESRYDCNGGF
jgi:hypothetical protein